MKHVDIIIISWARNKELLQVTRKGLDSLFSSEPNKDITFHAYVVESNPEVYYEEYDKNGWNHTCTTVHPKEEFGYHKFLNIGRRLGNSPYVVLCNSDLSYEKNWASFIIDAMEIYPHILSASPWCPQTQGSNKDHLENLYEGYEIRNQIAGWCIFQQRKIYEILGDLDERFKFWYCDNDYAMELMTKKIPHVLVSSSVVNHHENSLGETGKTLLESEKYEITLAQEGIFRQKWSIN